MSDRTRIWARALLLLSLLNLVVDLTKFNKGKADEAVNLAWKRPRKASEMWSFLTRIQNVNIQLRGDEACRTNRCPRKLSLCDSHCLEMAHQNDCHGVQEVSTFKVVARGE
jgi:hypothetical protein